MFVQNKIEGSLYALCFKCQVSGGQPETYRSWTRAGEGQGPQVNSPDSGRAQLLKGITSPSLYETNMLLWPRGNTGQQLHELPICL